MAAGWADGLREYAARLMDEARMPGLAVAVALGGTPVFAAGFGLRDMEAGLPVTPDTVFGGASTTKSLTCVAILQLEEAGVLAVTDPVTRHLPEFRLPDAAHTAAVTIHHLMTHSSGMPPLPSRYWAQKRGMAGSNTPEKAPDWVPDHDAIDTPEALMAYIAAYGDAGGFALLGPPGTHFSYGNDGYALLGAIIARVSGQPYEEYVQAHILDPAGMTHSTFSLDHLATFRDVTRLYALRGEGYISGNGGAGELFAVSQFLDAPLWSAPGRLNSTAHDFLRYLEVFRTGGTVGGARLLAPESARRMMHPHMPTNVPGEAYGYGLSVARQGGLTVVGHGGGRPGISAHVMAVPELGFTAVALGNLAGVPVAKSLHAALHGVRGLEVDAPIPGPPEEATAHTPESLARYVGEYRSDEGARVVVALMEGALHATTAGSTTPLRPVRPHAFMAGEMYHRFLMDDARGVYGMSAGARIIPRL